MQKNVAVARAGEDNISRARTTKIAFTTEGVAHRLKMGGVYRFWNRVFGEAGLKWALSYPWHDALFPGEKISAPSRARGQLYRLVREIYLAARGIWVGLFSRRYKDNA